MLYTGQKLIFKNLIKLRYMQPGCHNLLRYSIPLKGLGPEKATCNTKINVIEYCIFIILGLSQKINS